MKVRAVSIARQTATLLDEERRLFYVAVTRARRRLVVTAVHSGDGEEQPSRFLRELVPPPDEDDGEPEATRLPRALTLDALVAELRVALTDPASDRIRPWRPIAMRWPLGALRRRRPAPARRRRRSGRGPVAVVGPGAICPTAGRSSTTASRSW